METSEALRRRVHIPTIESQLRVRRLKWCRQLLAHRFSAATRKHTWDASLAIRTALHGTFSFETSSPQITERQRQLLDDAKELVQMHEQAQMSHRDFTVPEEITDDFLRWVAGLSDDDLNQLYRYDSTLDAVSEPAELLLCPLCGRTFEGLATHCRSKHGAPVQMAATPGQTCSRCQKTFSTRSNMMYHFDHYCSHRDISPSSPSSHQQHQQHHRPIPSASPPVPPTVHAQAVTVRNPATDILQFLASAHVCSSIDLMIALAKLTLQYEQERQNRARSENFVLEAMVGMYEQEGKTTRANQGDHYAGHPQGKRPDALFRGVLYWLVESVRENQQAIEQRLQTDEPVAAALKRVLQVGEQAAQNRDLKALRCFRVKSKDEAGQDVVRWIFAPSRQQQLADDLWTLREAKTLGASAGVPTEGLCSQGGPAVGRKGLLRMT